MDLAVAISLSNLELTRFFVALVLLLLAAHVLGFLFYEMKMPRVIGEILGGLLLGPTVLGYFTPDTQNWIFGAFPSEGKLLSLVSNLGLVLLMLVSGFEMQRSFSRADRRIATTFLVVATLVPFLSGILTPEFYNFGPYTGPNGNSLSTAIIVGIGVSVTSIPVLSKIFLDLRIMDTRFAKIVLAIATAEDVIQFAALAVATGVAGASIVSVNLIFTTVLTTTIFFGLSLLVLPRLVLYTHNSRFNVLIKTHPSRYALFLCFSLVAIASLLNVNIVFGSFLAGMAVGTLPDETLAKARSQIKAISFATFTPAYFAIVGLKLDLI